MSRITKQMLEDSVAAFNGHLATTGVPVALYLEAGDRVSARGRVIYHLRLVPEGGPSFKIADLRAREMHAAIDAAGFCLIRTLSSIRTEGPLRHAVSTLLLKEALE